MCPRVPRNPVGVRVPWWYPGPSERLGARTQSKADSRFGGTPMDLSSQRVAYLRSMLPSVQRLHYLNQGTCGPLPEPAHTVLARAAEEEWRTGRILPEARAALEAAMAAVRRRLARMLDAPDGSIALTHRTTDGMNIAVLGQNWQPGDVVLTTSLEHVGGLAWLPQLRQRGVAVHVLSVGAGEPDRVLEALAAGLARFPRARLVVASHVAYATGATLPIARMADLCHRAGARLAVDGAQSVGAVPTSVRTLDVDYLAFPAQKWLFGPEAIGGLYVSPKVLEDTLPPVSGGASFAHEDTRTLRLDFHPDARRYEVGTSIYRPAMHAFAATLTWLEETVGLPWLMDRINVVATRLRDGVAASLPEGFSIRTPAAAPSGLLVVDCGGRDANALVARARARDILIRAVPHGGIRFSASFFLDDHDLDAVVAWLREESLQPSA